MATEPTTKPNGVADSSPNHSAIPWPPPSPDSLALKVIGILILLAGAFGGTVLLGIERGEAMIEKHGERPHVGAAPKEAVERLEKKIDKQSEMLTKIFVEIQK